MQGLEATAEGAHFNAGSFVLHLRRPSPVCARFVEAGRETAADM